MLQIICNARHMKYIMFTAVFAVILACCMAMDALSSEAVSSEAVSSEAVSSENAVSAKPGEQFAGIGKPDSLSLRRATLIVRDIDRSLALYRDAIGMEVIYDNIIRRPHKTEDRMQEIRLVFLKDNNDFIGVLGLVDYEYNNLDYPMHTKPCYDTSEKIQ